MVKKKPLLSGPKKSNLNEKQKEQCSSQIIPLERVFSRPFKIFLIYRISIFSRTSETRNTLRLNPVEQRNRIRNIKQAFLTDR